MSTRLDVGMERALVVLDVPIVIAEELAGAWGERVWWQLVQNARAKMSARAGARHLLEEGSSLDGGLYAVVLGMRYNVMGVRKAVAECNSTPGCLIYWGMKLKMFNEEQQRALVTHTKDRGVRWYLAHHADLEPPAMKEARRRSRWGRGSEFNWRLASMLWAGDMANIMNWRLSLDIAKTTPLRDVDVGTSCELERIAACGRTFLGNGDTDDSLVAWRRFFDLVQAGMSDDLEQLIGAAYLVQGVR